MITNLLIANRGEIACRIIRTAHAMGISTTAIHTAVDGAAPHVSLATRSIELPGRTPGESYLDRQLVLDAARRAGADAIHPGYGFLSENAEFARAVVDAGLTWVGPTPESISAMGDKIAAKRIAAEAGVPLLPGAELDAGDVNEHAATVGFPLLIKASAGGGGKGMRVVREAAALEAALAAAQREAASAFGNPTVFLERYIAASRHVEVQVFGDMHGNAVHLFERECSLQRRHQKLIEESPSPGATRDTLEQMYACSVSLAKAIGYVGAGTVEFLVTDDEVDQQFYFLEMNTRLQVEHPVTEAITGLDLVEWQLRVAVGERLPRDQSEIERTGHAVEARIYAEDPTRDFLPSTGTITLFNLGRSTGVRVDAGVAVGTAVTPFYDSMLAKVIAHRPSRSEAHTALVGVLRMSRIAGVGTNATALANLLVSEHVTSGRTTTELLAGEPSLLDDAIPAEVRDLHVVAAVLATYPEPTESHDPPNGFRNVTGVAEAITLAYEESGLTIRRTIALDWLERRHVLSFVEEEAPLTGAVGRCIGAARLAGHAHGNTRLIIGGVGRDCEIHSWLDGESHAHIDVIAAGWQSSYRVIVAADEHLPVDDVAGPTAPVPGTVTAVSVAVGDHVTAGQALVTLEAMKMEHVIAAAHDGVVTELAVRVGQAVEAHAVLVTIEADE